MAGRIQHSIDGFPGYYRAERREHKLHEGGSLGVSGFRIARNRGGKSQNCGVSHALGSRLATLILAPNGWTVALAADMLSGG